MSPVDGTSETDPPKAPLEGDTYEIIRKRLLTQGNALKTCLAQLNQARKAIFGAIETRLLATERITTKNNCIPRDMVPIAGPSENRFIFGYNVHMGLKSEMGIADVFSVFQYENQSFTELPIDIIRSNRFEEDFKSLYKYYKETAFAKFSVIGPYLFMVFRVGKTAADIKTFKWLLKDGAIEYVDNRSDHEFNYPTQQEFTWIRTKRDFHRFGEHPHISIEERLFVEAVGGDITFKIEDNTETGLGIYNEPVEQREQTLDDAEIEYALLGHLILVRIKPYLEKKTRYFIYNEKLKTVCRVDEIENACVLLPDDHGLIFSNGYYLMTGELKIFDRDRLDMMYEGRLASANGEDFLYMFYNQEQGDYILLPYNIIEQAVETPIRCSGFAAFKNGEMLQMKTEDEPTRHHTIQVWQTPFLMEQTAVHAKQENLLYKIGNPEIVRFMAEANELIKHIEREESYQDMYVDIVKKTVEIADAYFWLDTPAAFDPKSILLQIKEIASGAIDEFAKLVRLKRQAAEKQKEVGVRVEALIARYVPQGMTRIDLFVDFLNGLRKVRGEIIALRELRHMDIDATHQLEQTVKEATEKASHQCVKFLLTAEALAPFEARIPQFQKAAASMTRVSDAQNTLKDLKAFAHDLEMLIEIVGNLKIEDATQTTKIIDKISDIFTELNKVKATLTQKMKALRRTEGVAEFNAQLKLLNQSAINFLDMSDTKEKCAEYAMRILVQLESLEGRFAEFDEYIVQLAEKRAELTTAFENRKLHLVETANKKADALSRSAERILNSIAVKVGLLKEAEAIHSYFAADQMVAKIREMIQQLVAMEHTVKADDLESRLKTLKEDAVRQLKDRQELFVDGANIIQFGNFKFSVNQHPLDLTILPRDGVQYFHLNGTRFFEAIDDEAFNRTKPVWDMEIPSENASVYRSEFLAFQLLKDLEVKGQEYWEQLRPQTMNESNAGQGDARRPELLAYIQAFMGPRYTESYTKGVHDQDAAKILAPLCDIHFASGLLTYPPRKRALARMFWMHALPPKEKERLRSKLRAFGAQKVLFPAQGFQENYVHELEARISRFIASQVIFTPKDSASAARYLFEALSHKDHLEEDVFCISLPAFELASQFLSFLAAKNYTEPFKALRAKLAPSPMDELELLGDWLLGFIQAEKDEIYTDYLWEAAVILSAADKDPVHQSLDLKQKECRKVPMACAITGMAGDHPVIREGKYQLNYIRFIERLTQYEEQILPFFRRFQEIKKTLTAQKRAELKLDTFKPRILSSFVRNQLINKVYLPLIGENLAKQIGVVGQSKRTDLMGMLLLISPPGYGKTTLMEYLANRLGVIFMKINGPAIGAAVTSLDPMECPNAAAREEIQKLNLAFEMGDNVMIYLDDIQHLNPEFLQKFISLCDAQRKIEGVYKGVSRTYDFRGRKVVVVMAGNPFTESGEKFKIPDMLANRADTYNLGDILGNTADAFKMSYLENAITSNPVLNRLSSQEQKDIHGIIKMAESGEREGIALSGAYSAEEVSEMITVMEKLIFVREIILKVNQQYISSAAQTDAYREEPPFRLQGSYRNMNRIAEKILPIMNAEELKIMVLAHYENESQTLTTGAEANLLKFKELTGWLTETEQARWSDIKKRFKKQQLFQGTDQKDPVNRVVAQLSAFHDGLLSIHEVLAQKGGPTEMRLSEATLEQLTRFVRSTFPKADTATRSLPEKFEVISRVPSSMIKMIQKQFDLIQSFLTPTFNVTRRQSVYLNRIHQSVQELEAAFHGVIREKGDFDEAIVYYNTAIERYPQKAENYYYRGMAWYQTKKIDKALADIRKAVALRPQNERYQKFAAFLESEHQRNP